MSPVKPLASALESVPGPTTISPLTDGGDDCYEAHSDWVVSDTAGPIRQWCSAAAMRRQPWWPQPKQKTTRAGEPGGSTC